MTLSLPRGYARPRLARVLSPASLSQLDEISMAMLKRIMPSRAERFGYGDHEDVVQGVREAGDLAGTGGERKIGGTAQSYQSSRPKKNGSPLHLHRVTPIQSICGMPVHPLLRISQPPFVKVQELLRRWRKDQMPSVELGQVVRADQVPVRILCHHGPVVHHEQVVRIRAASAERVVVPKAAIDDEVALVQVGEDRAACHAALNEVAPGPEVSHSPVLQDAPGGVNGGHGDLEPAGALVVRVCGQNLVETFPQHGREAPEDAKVEGPRLL